MIKELESTRDELARRIQVRLSNELVIPLNLVAEYNIAVSAVDTWYEEAEEYGDVLNY